jgi:4-aminobutyrate aminotransferase-like enzyme
MAKRGVMVAGGLPNTVKLTPPLRITRDEIEHGLESLDQSLADYEQSLG